MSPLKPQDETGRAYWRSLEELEDTDVFREMLAREFPGQPFDAIPPATRRQFMRVMAASMAFAGLTACRWPKEEILPFASRPEDRRPGVPQRFATTLEVAGVAVPLLVTSYDGRPIKIEGNPAHPASLGAASAVAQASVLELYDPDRSRGLTERLKGKSFPRSWGDFEKWLNEVLQAAGSSGSGVAVLSEKTSSPTVERLRARLVGLFPELVWCEHEPTARHNERSGLRSVYGSPLRMVPRPAGASTIACFSADPLSAHPDTIRLSREIVSSRRGTGGRMNRIWAVESGYSLTGGMADHRLALGPRHVVSVLLAVAGELRRRGIDIPGVSAVQAPDLGSQKKDFAIALAADLAAHRGQSLVLVGEELPPEAHALGVAVNEELGARGTTFDLVEESSVPDNALRASDLLSRAADGTIQTLIVLGGNPAYDDPLGLGKALETIPSSVHLTLHPNETSSKCRWVVPRAHALESWGDARSWDGTVTLAQPLIEPLYGGRTVAELLAMVAGLRDRSGRDLLKGTLSARGSDWRQNVQRGFVQDSAPAPSTVRMAAKSVTEAASRLAGWVSGGDGPTLRIVPDPKVFDGRFANSGWLQELPDPMTKVTWDNPLLMAPSMAEDLGLRDGDVVRVSSAAGSVELPVYRLPGHSPRAVTASLGYGRRAGGRVAMGVGVDVAPLLGGASERLVNGVSLEPTGRRVRLASTQDHHAIDRIGFEARNHRIGELVREATLDEYLKDPKVIQEPDHDVHLFSLWKEHSYEGEQWGMAIDLSACTGCNACVVACQAENNIPVVGPEQVRNGREMHWIRVDRYFHGETEDAEVVHQPMACVQCENAPCEQVCPVAATQHTRDGLNAMVYNRCVGTRYCSNNCPYKVRRFNFFNYHKELPELAAMQHNPEVTVRSRGVMEKCTYCVQRIEAARIQARRERRPIRDGEIVPACAQTCPAQAIVFGDLNDPKSMVSSLRQEPRGYAMLAELNVRPRTHYLARLRNPVADGKERA